MVYFFDGSGVCTDKYKYREKETPQDWHLVSHFQLNKELDAIDIDIEKKADLTDIEEIKQNITNISSINNNLVTNTDLINKKLNDHITQNKTLEDENTEKFLNIFDKLGNIPTVLIRIAGTSKFNYCIKIGDLTIPIAKIELTPTTI